MSDCCSKKNEPCCPASVQEPFDWFRNMIENCLAYVNNAKAAGHPVVGIMCEYAPRELILAARGVPVCLCCGSAKMVEPAECDLPTNLCPIIKSGYGYHLTHGNPFLEMADLLVVETTCDGKKKMYELLAESRPLYLLELPHRPDESEGLAYWRRELDWFKAALESKFGVEITPCKLREAIRTMNEERRLRRELAGMMQADCPPLTGRQLLELKSSISGIPADLAQYRNALEQLSGKRGDPELSSRVRVLLTGVPTPHGAERVIELIESSGGLIVCQENCTGVKPILEDVDETHPDPMQALVEKYFHLPCSVMTRNTRRLESLRQLAADYRPQCIIELVWQACITYDVESYYVRQLAEELHIPYLRIHTDFSPADTARIAIRIEALFETVREMSRSR